MPVEEIRFQRQLLVEGRTAVPFARALLRKLGHEANVQVQNFGSRNDFGGFLGAFVRMPGFGTVKSVGVLIDAEDEPAGTCRSVINNIAKAGLSASPDAREFSHGTPRVGFFVIPDESSSGMIETLCLRSVEDDPALACVDEYFLCLESKSIPQPRNINKARTQAFLASRDRAGLLVGEAAHAGYWNWDHISMLPLRQFLVNLATV